MDLKARDVMKKKVLNVEVDWPLERLAEFLMEHSISGAPVLSEEGKLVGVVSSSDIVQHASLPTQTIDEPHEYYLGRPDRPANLGWVRIYENRSASVRDLMTPMVFEVDGGRRIQEVADMMIRGRIHRVFVTENGQLEGVITGTDMLEVIRSLP